MELLQGNQIAQCLVYQTYTSYIPIVCLTANRKLALVQKSQYLSSSCHCQMLDSIRKTSRMFVFLTQSQRHPALLYKCNGFIYCKVKCTSHGTAFCWIFIVMYGFIIENSHQWLKIANKHCNSDVPTKFLPQDFIGNVLSLHVTVTY